MLVSKLFAKDFPNLFEKKNKNNKKNPPKKQHILLLAIPNNNHKLVLSNIFEKDLRGDILQNNYSALLETRRQSWKSECSGAPFY